MSYRVDFNSIAWESPMPGVRHKVVRSGDRVLRLVLRQQSFGRRELVSTTPSGVANARRAGGHASASRLARRARPVATTDQNFAVTALVEYAREMAPHVCERGHMGHIVDGEMVIEFASGSQHFRGGDPVLIPAGPEHAHRAVIISEVVTALFVEDA